MNPATTTRPTADALADAPPVAPGHADLSPFARQVASQVAKTVVGQHVVVERVLIALLTGGHLLLEGVPGIAKTLMVQAVAKAIDLKFNRVQFTIDLLPSDILGAEILDQKSGSFRVHRGPVFTNLLLADEINRASPKVQSALLEAMQERKVSIGDTTHELPAPFLVIATQNPVEQAGTFELPEAQLDRFMLNIKIGYPTYAEELAIVESTTGSAGAELRRLLDGPEVLACQDVVRRVPVAENVTSFAVRLVRATRAGTAEQSRAAAEFVAWGAGPRAAQFLVRGAKARALLDGRPTPSLEDIRRLAHPVLRHRLVANFHAEAEGMGKDDIIDRILSEVAP